MLGIRWEALPNDCLSFLGYYIHSHQHVQSVINPSSNVFFVMRFSVGVTLLRLKKIVYNFVSNFIERRFALFLHFFANACAEMAKTFAQFIA